MKSKLKLTVYLTVIGCLLLFVGWFIPYWFGRRYEYNRKTEWGLFYFIVCELGRCKTIDGAIRTGSVDFVGGSGTVELLAIPVLATISFGLALMSTILCLLVYNKCICTEIRKFHLYSGVVTLLTTTVIFSFITIVVAGVASAQFFQHKPVSSVIEVPWSLICYSVGEILLISAEILFILIVRKYLEYRRLRYSSEKSNSGVYAISLRYYPGKYTQTDHELHIRPPFYVSTGYEFDHFGSAVGQHEPPPDYDINTLVRKPSRTHQHYVSKAGYKRIPRRYRHPHDVDHGDTNTDSHLGLSSKYTYEEEQPADRRLPLMKDIPVHEHKNKHVHMNIHDHIKTHDRKTDAVRSSGFWHRSTGVDRGYHHPDGKSSSSSDTELSDYQLNVTDKSHARSVTSTTLLSGVIQYPGTMRTDISKSVSLWYTPRDYGTLTYAGKSETEF